MTLVYALLYNVGDGGAEISGVYSTLKSAMEAIDIEEWKHHEGVKGFWEGIDKNSQMSYIEVHALQD